MRIARLEDGIVINIEIADQEWIDAQPDPSIFVEFTDENPAFIGGDYVDGFFYPPQPFASWLRDSGEWIAPSPRPDGDDYIWSEDDIAWLRSVADE